jgi:hypothetical protein
LLKDYLDYFDDNVKSCGLEIRYKYFEKIKVPSTDVQRLGIFFEYMATGYKHPNDPIPQPDLVYKGTPKEKLAADYERAVESAALFREMMKNYNIEPIAYGEYMLYDGCSGISDIYAKWNGEECIIDVKYSGLFDDKFSDYGWHTESLPYKSKTMLQPIHYKYLSRKLKNIEDIPFYFWIFHSKQSDKAKIIKTNIDLQHINLHEEITIGKMKKYINYHYNNPEALEARPNYIRCKDCAFYDMCDKKATVPTIEEIYY